MEIPILVAIISVTGTLLGTVVGGAIASFGSFYLTRRQERLVFRTACRLVAVELQDNSFIVEFALKNKLWWRSDEELTTEAWKQYQNVLAPHLPYEALVDLGVAVNAVKNVKLLAAQPRPLDQPSEIFFGANCAGAYSPLESHEKGRCRPYTIPSLAQ